MKITGKQFLSSSLIMVSAAWSGSALAGKSEGWGVIGRNTLGSPSAVIAPGPMGRTGPEFAATQKPPCGKDSIQIAVAGVPPGGTTTDAEKLMYGNETEFAGMPISSITTLMYAVFVGQDTAGTLPGIAIEANDPDGAFSYTSLVYLPSSSSAPSAPAVPANNTWQVYNASAAGSQWFATGAGGAATGCTGGSPCSFNELKVALPPNTIVSYSLGFSKGRDNAFVGALDCLVINDTVYDFERKKVKSKKAEKFLESLPQ